MKLAIAGGLLALTMLISGCGNTNNYYSDPNMRSGIGVNAGQAVCEACTSRQAACSDCANGYVAEVAIPTVPLATQIVTSYEEVYATEYTPTGPVVKKQLIPVKSTVPLVAEAVLMNTPNGYAASYGVPVVPTAAGASLPVIIGTPPARKVVPIIEEPVAWFGPTAAPNYSTQTNWF